MANTHIYEMADTWNAIGTTFNGIMIDISNGASGAPVGAAASRALNIKANGTSVFNVTVAGGAYGPLGSAAAVAFGHTGNLGTGMFFPSASNVQLAANGTGVFNATATALSIPSGSSYNFTSGALGAAIDATIVRDAADTVALRRGNNNQTMRFGGANAAYSQISTLNESHTLAAAGTSDTTIQFPANSIALGVTVRVTTLITGCTTFDVGVAGATTRYGTGIDVAATTTNVSTGTTTPDIYNSATSVRFTAIGGGAAFTAGVIRVTLHYISLSAPTS